jgi:uncharacterized protein with HEPN domain
VPTNPTERLRRNSLSLPEATERETWDTPTFRVRDKIVAMSSDQTTEETFKHDEVTQHAFTHLVHLIERSARNVSSEGRTQIPTVPRERLTEMPHHLVPYEVGVDLNRMWNTLVDVFPIVVSELLKTLPEDPPDDFDPSELT